MDYCKQTMDCFDCWLIKLLVTVEMNLVEKLCEYEFKVCASFVHLVKLPHLGLLNLLRHDIFWRVCVSW